MALRGKALHRLCQSLWRVNVSGGSGHGDVLHPPSFACRPRRQSSSLSQFPHPPLSTAHTPSLPPPPCLHPTKGSNFNASLHKSLRVAGAGAAETGGHTSHPQKEAADKKKNMLDIDSARITGLGVHAVNQHPHQPVTGTWSLSSWPGREHMEYICPSEKLTTLLEPLPRHTPSYDLPRTSDIVSPVTDPTPVPSAEISEPTDGDRARHAPKEAREIMKIRRKKMKRHLLKKFRKRMAFTLRRIRRERRKKKEAAFQSRLSGIRDWGESFNAEDWVREQLDRARRGGFYINILGEQQQGKRR